MKIALVQSSLFWEDPKKNREEFGSKIRNIDADLVVLPEMFSTGFTMDAEKVAEPHLGETYQWMKSVSQEQGFAIVGSIVVEENGQYFNRLYFVKPDGTSAQYDKRHLFRMADEHHHYTAGFERTIIEYKGVRFCPLVCYDLRFPVWSRNVSPENMLPEYDCLIYVANWPEARVDAWTSLLKARSIENQCYVVGVNRVGEDGKGISYSGGSRAFDPKGARLDQFEWHQEQVEMIEIDMSSLADFREKFPVSKDADQFNIVI